MEIITVTLPATWATALVCDEWAGLEYYYPEEAEKARTWVNESGLTVLTCGDDTFVAMFDGLLTECREYQCTPKGGSHVQ